MIQKFFLNLHRQTIKTGGNRINTGTKVMKKSINIQVLGNQKYFNVYIVKAVKHDGEVIVYDSFLYEKDAQEAQEFIYEHMTELYKIAFIREEMIWC